MDENVLERNIFHEFTGHEHHAGNPEEDDVIARDQDAGREELLEIRRLIRPAHGRERPEGRAEPCIEDVRVAVDVFAVAVLTFRNIFPANRGLAAVVAVPDRDLMAPPELAADAPVVDIFQPMVVNLNETIRDEFRVAIFDGFEGCFGQRFHLDEPLLGDEGFDRRLAARAMADGMGQFFDMIEEAQFFQVSDDGFTAIFTGHAVVFRTGFFVHRTVEVHDHDGFQVMALAHFKVVRVVSRRNLDGASTEADIDVIVSNDFDFAVDEGDDDFLADVLLHAVVVGVDSDSRIAHDRFRTSRSNHDIVVFTDNRVFDVPQMALHVGMVNFDVRQGRMAVRAPVGNALALIDEAFFIKRDEDFADGAGTGIIHGEALAAPVAGRTEAADLFFDAAAVLFLPGPDAFEKFFTADVIAALAFFLGQLLFDLYLRSDAGMVCARDPGDVIAFHALEADEDILQGIVQGMAHVKLARDVRRRHDDAERFFARIRILMEVAILFPKIIPGHFNVVRCVSA